MKPTMSSSHPVFTSQEQAELHTHVASRRSSSQHLQVKSPGDAHVCRWVSTTTP
jgi:hypothetical protein